MKKRCSWVTEDLLYVAYHDQEWGVPVHDDRKHFEMLVLEGAQAGLSWITILRKRENYRSAMDNFEPHIIAGYNQEKLDQLQQNSGIIRNRLKIASAVRNAQAFLRIQEEFGSFDAYIWRFVGGIPLSRDFSASSQMPTKNEQSDAMSKDLKKRGFNFVGSTICYSYMQAIGMVNDHALDCFRHSELDIN